MKKQMALHTFMEDPAPSLWLRARRRGWEGSDGSSFSTDTICGVRIACTSEFSSDYRYPGNKHDWRYHLGRVHRLGEMYRKAADVDYRDGCLKFVRRELSRWNPLRYVAIPRCHARYAGLRVGARFAWTKKSKTRVMKWGPSD